MSTRTCLVSTDSDGAFTWERSVRGRINAIEVQLQTLETPDVLVTDGTYDTQFLDLTGVAADAVYQPGAALVDDSGADIAGAYGPAVVMGTLSVEIANGGANKVGRIIFLLET